MSFGFKKKTASTQKKSVKGGKGKERDTENNHSAETLNDNNSNELKFIDDDNGNAGA